MNNYWLEFDRFEAEVDRRVSEVKADLIEKVGRYLDEKSTEFQIAVLDFDMQTLDEIRQGAVDLIELD